MELEALLNYPGALPAMSRTVADLMSEMNKDDPSPKRVAELVGQDPSLTTRVLRLSNSSFFRASRKIGSAEEAVAMLGMTHVRSLVMAAALGSSFKNVPGVNLPQFWRYSLRVADISKSLAGLLRQQEANAYTAGLIHAIGDLVMHIAMPDEIAPLDMGTPPLDLQRAQAERNRFDYTYAEVGAGMVERWNFPTAIVSALKHQTAPFDGDVYDPLAGILHLASWRARAEEIQLDDGGLAATFPDMVGLTLGLDLGSVLGKDPAEWEFTDALSAFLD
ncbi:MAG: HDOD domain-containing protein [Hydrogenophaga sp.]|uniref:HDOD domain-containing protein n=1 Tax=Hydrogenophaga sp. TaxID=1904254 RepID=UPI0016A69491|nr:HDOD domain-containing protein [Hydrogenophaga sp.]NIM42877.1 HDOD domain-containing protein [Hydrogenophaga sp.]NIN27810.1 HDOD domain-containing protein [Hydrogenophaga sp.]NIN32629.1 HDOD domain-containing protein [Hydrogenophaga sp.]NIN57083.1 HDOD domain-containing protein [Hydrogenophaga sp.]NIO53494.1 HDOD domain-containing protein [Hydrogenophaga sp.]